jgi:hypothetical protein
MIMALLQGVTTRAPRDGPVQADMKKMVDEKCAEQ